MVTNSSDQEAYPISGFTWIIIYREQSYGDRSVARAKETVKFLDWLLGPDGQAIAESVNYAPLPSEVSSLARKILTSLTFENKSIE